MKKIYFVANGDLRLSANQACWSAQVNVESKLITAIECEGYDIHRAHGYDEIKKHGFIDSQVYGMEVFRSIPKNAPLIVVEAVWQYSHHLLQGLYTHEGPILTVANWSGQWPGLVGMLNLNGSLTKAGISYSTLWSADFTDNFFLDGLREWLNHGKTVHDTRHVTDVSSINLPDREAAIGYEIARQLQTDKAIMGVFDEGCMGMYNAIIPDELLHPVGVFKERLSQSSLFSDMEKISDEEAQKVRDWLDTKGMTFKTGSVEEFELTDNQILAQCKMYISALRIADDFGCDVIGIQYQQGLKDLTPASDLVEGLLNSVDRPPVYSRDHTRILFAGRALPHFNEVDECAGLDALLTNRIWNELGLDPETTLHDIRYGENYMVDGIEEFVWVFEISGAVPPKHLLGGYAGAVSERQPPMYFPLGGGTIKGVSKPGEIVWSRIFVEDGCLQADIGRAKAVELPRKETERRWKATTSQWPIMHAVTYGIGRNELMARHKSNHIQVAYGTDATTANSAMIAKIAAFSEMGIKVHLCGEGHGLD